ncbi:unnamed protein product [Camellia sinensis]
MEEASLMVLLLSALLLHSIADDGAFDLRQHVSTVTRYGVVNNITDNSFVPSNIPDQCTPIHLNLVLRHGTRAPTKEMLNDLALRMEILLQDAKEQKLALQKVPAWFWGWKSPWQGKLKGGELISEGEDELYNLGIRTRDKFPQLFNEDYHPNVYAIRATQAYRKSQEPAVHKLKEPALDEITHALVRCYNLNFTRQDTSSLRFLYKKEASLLNITDQACALFSPFEVVLLEWTYDLELFILKGYGNALNYQMGVPLLEDVVQSMEQAIMAKEEEHAPGSYEKARLRFAHAETLLPFSCLIGLFLEESDFEKIQKEQPLQLPPKPPQRRNWRGSVAVPFGGNNMMVVYSCPAKSSSKYFVHVLHNEHPVPMLERIVAPHLKYDYNTICNLQSENPEPMALTI